MAEKSKKTVSPKEKGLNQLSIMLITAVLRYNSDVNHKLGTKQIVGLLSDITLQYFDERIVNRHLNYIRNLTDIAEGTLEPQNNNKDTKADVTSLTREEAQYRLNALVAVIGGYIRCTYINQIAAEKKAKNSKMLYYFDPIINRSEFELIKGALTSNRYIRNDELNYLTDALHFLHPDISEADNGKRSDPEEANNRLKKRPSYSQTPPKRNYRNQASIILRNINTIYDAIQDEHQIEITYGVFEESHNRIIFVADGKDTRVLNPYAMMWSNGQQYLLASPANDSEHIFHFRIDRIYGDVAVHQEPYKLPSGKTKYRNTKRESIPQILQPYFKKNIFQEDLYRSTHPHMTYSRHNSSEAVLLNCSQQSLATIIDNFGQDGQHIMGRTIVTKSSNLNLPFPDGYTINIIDADYDAVKHFCLQLQNDIYVIEPDLLREEIISELSSRLGIYTGIKDNNN
jgi:hypothetical protein